MWGHCSTAPLLRVALLVFPPLAQAFFARREGNSLPIESTNALAVSNDGILQKTLLRVDSKVRTREACTRLKNAGSYFTANVKVGTNPGKTFDIVADTGSNSVIVTSCQCAISGSCTADDRCLNQSDSTTLHVNKTKDGKVPVVMMGFGSGKIEAEIGTDKVTIGSVTADMNDQLLLMVDKALDLKGKFEGILGLGIPEADASTWTGKDRSVKTKEDQKTYITKGFLQEAGLTRFSICFQDSSDTPDGTLRVDIPALTNPLGSVGTKHWGLDFRGISVGGVQAPVKFCKDSELKDGQATPCGAIPDSGTTLILGPTEHLVKLYDEICDSWPRCKNLWSDSVTALGIGKSDLVEAILANCSSWMNGSQEGLDELPELNFKLRGAEGTDQILSFKGSQYVESGDLDVPNVPESLASRKTLKQEPYLSFLRRHRPSLLENRQGQYVCLPALGAVDYNTETNGPVWILGTPLFYAFEVSFESGTHPPSIQMGQGSCTSCAGSMAEAPSSKAHQERPNRHPRRIRGEVRAPTIPLTGPL